MKALVYTDLQKMEYQTDYPMPNEEFLVRVMGCGVCGTDLKTYVKGHAYFKPPCVLGHEFYGEVIKTPEGLGYKNGDLVVVSPYFGCGECALCEKEAGSLCQNQSYVDYGAFAEVVGINPSFVAKGVFPISEADDVYTLVEPLACVINGVKHLNIYPKSKVLVVGGGPMGVLFALLLKAQNVELMVVEPSETRRNLIISMGLPCCTPDEVKASEYDNVVVAVNRQELVEEYVEKVADAGTVLLFGGLKRGEDPTVSSHAIHYRQVTLTGSYGLDIAHFREALSMVEANKDSFRQLITHRLPLEEGEKAFEMLQKAEALDRKSVV